MGLAGWGVLAEAGSGGADGPGDGEGLERGEEMQLGRVGEAGVLEIQAAGLGVAEERFNGPAFAVGGGA